MSMKGKLASCQIAISDNVGVKQFSSTLLHALKQERHFTLLDGVAFSNRRLAHNRFQVFRTGKRKGWGTLTYPCFRLASEFGRRERGRTPTHFFREGPSCVHSFSNKDIRGRRSAQLSSQPALLWAG